MDRIIRAFPAYVASIAITFSIGFVVFTLAERFFGIVGARKPWREMVMDLKYLMVSVFMEPLVSFLAAAFLTALSFYIENDHAKIPGWLFTAQVIAVLFCGDTFIYIEHRIFHQRALWSFHSVHHAPEELNWLTTARLHPLETFIQAFGRIVILAACSMAGFNYLALAVAVYIVNFYNFFIHSNLKWTLGPLRYFLVSPVLHRWHHSDDPKAFDRNFATMFSIIDVLFDTFYMPKDAIAQSTGLAGEDRVTHPRSFLGQIFLPFRKK